MREIFPNLRRHGGNVYETFARSRDLRCCAISSGSMSEAACFGHQARYLFQPIYSWWSGDGDWPEESYIHLHAHDFLSPATWRGILGAMGDLPDCPGAKLERPFMPCALRSLHNVSWGYNDAVLQRSLYNRDATRLGLLAQPTYLRKWLARGRWLLARILG